jgi:predicted kinase
LTSDGSNQAQSFGGIPSKLALETAVPLRNALAREFDQTQPGPSDKPCLILLSGLPGTGKSHFAKELGKRLPLLVLESDRLRKVLAPNPKYTRAESHRLFAACHLLIEEYLLQDRLVLLDATNLTEDFRQPVYDIAQRVSVPLILARLTAPRELVRSRLSERGAGMHPSDYSDAGWLIYSRMYPHEEIFTREHLNVDSSGDISESIREVVRLVKGDNRATLA